MEVVIDTVRPRVSIIVYRGAIDLLDTHARPVRQYRAFRRERVDATASIEHVRSLTFYTS